MADATNMCSQTPATPYWDGLAVGDSLPALALPSIDRELLACYAQASGDRNPLHLDPEAARRGGFEDVIAHGMLSAAWLGRLLTRWTDQRQLRDFEVRFAGITQLGECITCSAKVVEKFHEQGEARVRLALQTANQAGEVRLLGSAVVAIGSLTENGGIVARESAPTKRNEQAEQGDDG